MRFTQFCTTSIFAALAFTQSAGAVATHQNRLQINQIEAADPYIYTQIAAETDVTPKPKQKEFEWAIDFKKLPAKTLNELNKVHDELCKKEKDASKFAEIAIEAAKKFNQDPKQQQYLKILPVV